MAIDANVLEQELRNFIGTEHYYRISPSAVLTDGTKFWQTQLVHIG